jgi:predicted nucleic acid-binding Zn ribbon protein
MDSDNYDYFDFSTEQELPEEQASQMKPCPHCKQPIPAHSLFCLYCGEAVTSSRKHRWMIIVAIFVLVAFVLLIVIR